MSKDHEYRTKMEWSERGVIEEELEFGNANDALRELLDVVDIMEQRIAELESRDIREMLIGAGHKPRGE